MAPLCRARGLVAAVVALQCGVVLCQEEPGMQAPPIRTWMPPDGLGASRLGDGTQATMQQPPRNADAFDIGETKEGQDNEDDKFPIQEMKDKTAAQQVVFDAKFKVKQKEKQDKFDMKVLKVRVGRYSDYMEEVKQKDLDRYQAYNKRVIQVRTKEFEAKQEKTRLQEKAEAINDAAARSHERANKADVALQVAVKDVSQMKAGEGENAAGDRMNAQSMLHGLKAAQAFADGTLPNLSAEQRKLEPMQMMYKTLENAVGNPSANNLNAAKKTMSDQASWANDESYQKIDKLQAEVQAKKDQKVKEEVLSKEVKQKDVKIQNEHQNERHSKKLGTIFKDTYTPAEMTKEKYLKHTNEEVMRKWHWHQDTVTDEIEYKGEEKFKYMKDKERDSKKKKAAEAKILAEECKKLEKRKMNALEKRNKSIGQFSAKRKALLVAQDAMDNVKKHDPCAEKPHYVSKGHECQKQDKYLLKKLPGGGCDKKCTNEAGKCEGYNDFGTECYLLKFGGPEGGHPECGSNPTTGDKDCAFDPNGGALMACNEYKDHGKCQQNQECTLYKAISGFAAMGESEGAKCAKKLCDDEDGKFKADNGEVCAAVSGGGRRLLSTQVELVPDATPSPALGRQLLGSGPPPPAFAPTPNPTPKPTRDPEKVHKADSGNKREAEMNTKEIQHKEGMAAQDKEMEDKSEKKNKAQAKAALAAEESSKQAAIAESLANEKSAKDALAEAGRVANNAETSMREANMKAADADTQARKCEGNKFRRRRTCACDDTTPPPPPGECAVANKKSKKKTSCEKVKTKEMCTEPCAWTATGRRLLDTSSPAIPSSWSQQLDGLSTRSLKFSRAQVPVAAPTEGTSRILLGDEAMRIPSPAPPATANRKLLSQEGVSDQAMAEYLISRRRAPPTYMPTRPTPVPSTHAPTKTPYSERDQKRDKKKMDNWERRRYVRRRYVEPTAADRRRRAVFPKPPPKPRVPGAVCPCKSRL